MAEIGIIVNHEELYGLGREATREYADSVAVALSRNYRESAAIARKMEREGVRVLMARGGHSTAIREAGVEVPLVSIPFTASNLTSLLLQVKERHGRFAVIGTSSLLDMVRELEVPMSLDVTYFQVEGWDSFTAHVQSVLDQGIGAVLGGYDATSFAARAGLDVYQVKATAVEFAAALYSAQSKLERIKQEKHWNDLFRIILDSIYEGIVLVDAQGVVTHINRPAKRMLDREVPVLMGAPLQQKYLRQQVTEVLRSGVPVNNQLQKANDYKYSISILPIGFGGSATGAVMILQEVEQMRKMEQEVRHKLAQRGLVAHVTFDGILGEGREIQASIQTAKQYSVVDSTILINGESGTGKELFAQSIHNYSLRRNEAFVAVNCATIPPNLLESELFGYVDGAFTGARRGGKAGLFELAHNGTIFLDEISEISIDMQARLLRVLEERQIMRVGGDRVIPVNIRVITATNKDLRRMVAEGTFREDVYYRVNVLSLYLPPLRRRREDLDLLIRHYIRQFADRYNRNMLQLCPDAHRLLLDYEWPGNVRELKNIAECLVVTASGPQVGVEAVAKALHLPEEAGGPKQKDAPLLATQEFQLIARVLEECGGNKTQAAQRLGISRPTLHRRLREMEEKGWREP